MSKKARAKRHGPGQQEGRPFTARLVLGNAFEDRGGVAFGFDGGPDGFDCAGFADEKGAANDAHELTPHELLLLPGAIGLDSFVVRVAQQREVELVLGLEAGLGLDGVCAQAEDGHTALVELTLCVAKLGRLDGSTGGVGFGKQKKEDSLALKVLQGDVFVFVGLEVDAGSLVAGFEHEDPRCRYFSRVANGEAVVPRPSMVYDGCRGKKLQLRFLSDPFRIASE